MIESTPLLAVLRRSVPERHCAGFRVGGLGFGVGVQGLGALLSCARCDDWVHVAWLQEGGATAALAQRLSKGPAHPAKDEGSTQPLQCTSDEAHHLAGYLLNSAASNDSSSSGNSAASVLPKSSLFSDGSYDGSVPISNACARGSALITSGFKLQHDGQQLHLLLERGRLTETMLSAVLSPLYNGYRGHESPGPLSLFCLCLPCLLSPVSCLLPPVSCLLSPASLHPLPHHGPFI